MAKVLGLDLGSRTCGVAISDISGILARIYETIRFTDDDYDTLCSTEYGETTLLNAIMSCFDADAKECTRILNLITDDLIYDNSLNVVIGKLLYSLSGTLGDFITGMKDKMSAIGIEDVVGGDEINTKQLMNILKSITE